MTGGVVEARYQGEGQAFAGEAKLRHASVKGIVDVGTLVQATTMSTRGVNFLDRWLADNVPEATVADVISVDELTSRMLNEAAAIGIKRIEIDEEVDSLYRTILDAIVHHDAGLAD